MMWLKSYFTVYVTLLILAIGVYMAFIQSSNFIKEKMINEGRFSKTIGYIYIVIGLVGLFLNL